MKARFVDFLGITLVMLIIAGMVTGIVFLIHVIWVVICLSASLFYYLFLACVAIGLALAAVCGLFMLFCVINDWIEKMWKKLTQRQNQKRVKQ